SRLGVKPRDEHPSAAAAPHGHGHDHGEQGGSTAPGEGANVAAGEKPFSQVLREGSWSDHSDSEGSTFMEDIMRGKATLQDYVDLVVQHYYMYVALEETAAKLANEPQFAGFHAEGLERLPAIEADLAHLIGEDWRENISPVPATEAYAARIREIGEEGWVAGLVAHHYTRYLGDLSGGQMIAKRVSRQHELEQ